jgi:endonuclease/exonuclease/phosphatase family metal-dependent hydrolase
VGSPGRRSPGRGSLRDLTSLVPDRRAAYGDPTAALSDDELVVVSWNVFHGRDAPPGLAVRTPRTMLFRTTLHSETHVQVNRSLYKEFVHVLATSQWHVCLLQECPPRWADRLADECQAASYRALTSRNWLSPLRSVIAERNPDLMGAWEGGSNLTLVRPPWQLVESTSVLLNPLRERRLRERRRLGLTRLVRNGRQICAGNLHLSTAPPQATREALRAADVALEWAGDTPLVLAGDFNVTGSGEVFERLCNRAGLCGAHNPGIDQILARGLAATAPASPWEPEQREIDVLAGLERRRLRLSDHAPVEARFSLR